MIIVSKKSITILTVAYFILLELIFSAGALASNRLDDLNLDESNGQWDLTLLLEERPRIGLKPFDSGILFNLLDTAISQEVINKVSAKNDIDIIGTEENDCILSLSTGHSGSEMDTSWLEDEKLLHVRISPMEKNDKITSESIQSIPVLKGIRFGFKEKAARIVMKLDHEPLWEMRYLDSDSFSILLKASSSDVKEEEYGPVNWIEHVAISKQEKNQIDVSLKLEFPLNRIRAFWMDIGNRLVMDLYNEHEDIKTSALFPDNDSMSQSENVQTRLSAEESMHEEAKNESKGNIIRMNIPARETTTMGSDDSSDHEKSIINDQSVTIEPKLNMLFPLSSDITVSVEELTPEEAYLFGRIQGAMEINDYEKGALLVTQFMTEFPNSILSEKMSFWRGDFYYHLWKKGDVEAGTKAINSYAYAIERFGKSKYKNLTYIKMAQISSMIGNHFQAIGYLGMVINQKENNEYLPIAYLTRGKIFLNMDQPENAIQDFRTLLKEYPDTKLISEAKFWIANYYHKIGLYEEAEKNLKEISDSNPELYLEYPEFLLMNAKNYIYLEKYDLAREFLFTAINIGEQSEPIDMLLSRIGETYHNQGKEEEAEKYYRMVIDYYPDSEGASISKLRLADYFSDITLLEDVSDEKTGEPVGELALLEKAYQLFESKKYPEVMDTLGDLINKPVQTETRSEAKRLFVHAISKEIENLYRSQDYSELIDLYQARKMFLTDDRIDPNILIFVAFAFNKKETYDEAISLFSQIKSYDLNKDTLGSYYQNLADAYLGLGEVQKAQNVLEQAIKQDLKEKDRQKLILFLARIYNDTGLSKEAYELYDSLLSVKNDLSDNEIAEASYATGVILSREGKYELAKIHLYRCLVHASKAGDDQGDLISSASMEIGNILHVTGEFEKAIESFERGFDLGYGPEKSKYWEYRYTLALSYIKTGQLDKAETLLSEISEEGGTLLQQKAQLKLGTLNLERQLKKLAI